MVRSVILIEMRARRNDSFRDAELQWIRALASGPNTWRALLRKGSERVPRDQFLCIGLAAACRLGDAPAADALIRAGADDFAPRTLATLGRPLEPKSAAALAAVFLSHAATVPALPAATAVCQWGTANQLDALLKVDRGQDLSDAVDTACELGRADMLRVLHREGGATHIAVHGWTMLRHGSLEACKLVIALGPDMAASLCCKAHAASDREPLLRELAHVAKTNKERGMVLGAAFRGAHAALVAELLADSAWLQATRTRRQDIFEEACRGGDVWLARAAWQGLTSSTRARVLRSNVINYMATNRYLTRHQGHARIALALLRRCATISCPLEIVSRRIIQFHRPMPTLQDQLSLVLLRARQHELLGAHAMSKADSIRRAKVIAWLLRFGFPRAQRIYRVRCATILSTSLGRSLRR